MIIKIKNISLIWIASTVMTFSCNKKVEDNVDETIISIEKAAQDLFAKGDPSGIFNISAEEITYFDEVTKKRLNGLVELKEHYKPVIGKRILDHYDMIDPKVQIHGNTAVLTFNLIEYTKNDDITTQTYWNATEIFALIKGDWKIIHSHWSIPKKN
jgi:ketosteroid isomerase-like protein